jgi:hypothetical protein
LIQTLPENNNADMRTEVSIPDPVYIAFETLAVKLGMSLNELQVKAMTEFLARHKREDVRHAKSRWQDLSGDEITARLNEVYAHEPSHLDPFLAQLQARTFEKEEW